MTSAEAPSSSERDSNLVSHTGSKTGQYIDGKNPYSSSEVQRSREKSLLESNLAMVR